MQPHSKPCAFLPMQRGTWKGTKRAVRNADPETQGLLMVVSKRWFEFSGGMEFRYPLFSQFITSFLPRFYTYF